jgi:ADP-ribosyl-[dinitrogen reductase] hydrolase
MFGAIAGDVLGSTWEFHATKVIDFPLYPESSSITDDSICTAAIASALLRGRGFAQELRAFVGHSSGDNFGPRFLTWAGEPDGVLGDSAGNGACMRVSAIPALSGSLEEALGLAAESAKTSHHHPDSIRAAMATVAAGRLALEGWDAAAMGRAVEAAFGYDLSTPLDDYRAVHTFEPLARDTVGPSLRSVIEATSFEDGMRRVISMGGDADTMAATAGGVLQFYHPVPDEMRAFVTERVPNPLRQVLAAYEAAAAARPIVPAPRGDVPEILARALERALTPPPRRKGRLGAMAGRIRGLVSVAIRDRRAA